MTRIYDDPDIPVCTAEGCDENDWRLITIADCRSEASLMEGGGVSYDDAEWERYSGDDIDEWWECAAGHKADDHTAPLIDRYAERGEDS